MSLSTLLLGQQFPPPESFVFSESSAGDSLHLTWEPPSNASPTHYNIYYTTYWHGDIIIKVGTTTQTQAKFPWPDFPYKMCFGISASYENPTAESDTIFSCMSLLSDLTLPYYLFNFESGGHSHYIVATRTIGNETWELCSNTYFSPSRSARYISDTPGNSGSLWTANFMWIHTFRPNLSFWYKIPENQGLSDTLKVYLWHNSNLTTLMQPLSATEEWQYVEMLLSVNSGNFQIGFEATAAGGNGIYLDDFRVFDETVDVKDQPLKTASVDIYPNPASSFFHLNLNLPESANVKLTVCSMEGKVIKTNVSQHMMSGEQNLTMDVSDLKPGIYLVSMQINDNLINQKLIKF
jgi:hypothetical protein